jgi:hypothetical protein
MLTCRRRRWEPVKSSCETKYRRDLPSQLHPAQLQVESGLGGIPLRIPLELPTAWNPDSFIIMTCARQTRCAVTSLNSNLYLPVLLCKRSLEGLYGSDCRTEGKTLNQKEVRIIQKKTFRDLDPFCITLLRLVFPKCGNMF